MEEALFSKSLTALDLDIAARTVWAEARGESDAGKLAVAWVIRTRAETRKKDGSPYWWGDGIAGVCKKPWQFSCWNQNDPNRDGLLSLKTDSVGYQQALTAVALALVSNEDPTDGANHYHTKEVEPHWSEGQPFKIIGNHRFYRLE